MGQLTDAATLVEADANDFATKVTQAKSDAATAAGSQAAQDASHTKLQTDIAALVTAAKAADPDGGMTSATPPPPPAA
jgi:hypothetical protein